MAVARLAGTGVGPALAASAPAVSTAMGPVVARVSAFAVTIGTGDDEERRGTALSPPQAVTLRPMQTPAAAAATRRMLAKRSPIARKHVPRTCRHRRERVSPLSRPPGVPRVCLCPGVNCGERKAGHIALVVRKMLMLLFFAPARLSGFQPGNTHDRDRNDVCNPATREAKIAWCAWCERILVTPSPGLCLTCLPLALAAVTDPLAAVLPRVSGQKISPARVAARPGRTQRT